MGIITKLNNKEDFSLIEARIAQYILDNKEKVVHYSVKQLAQETYTSTSAVMRLIRKVYDGSFANFKVDLALEIKSEYNLDQHNYYEVKKNETFYAIMEKAANLEKDIITQTRALNDYQTFSRVTNLINKSNRLYVYADGINEQVGYEFKYMLARIGKAVNVVNSDAWVIINCLNEGDHPLAIYINHQEHNYDLQEKIELNHAQNIPAIAITGYNDAIYQRCCNEILLIPTGLSFSDLAPIIYSTAIRYILNTIVMSIISTNYEVSKQKLQQYTELSRYSRKSRK